MGLKLQRSQSGLHRSAAGVEAPHGRSGRRRFARRRALLLAAPPPWAWAIRTLGVTVIKMDESSLELQAVQDGAALRVVFARVRGFPAWPVSGRSCRETVCRSGSSRGARPRTQHRLQCQRGRPGALGGLSRALSGSWHGWQVGRGGCGGRWAADRPRRRRTSRGAPRAARRTAARRRAPRFQIRALPPCPARAPAPSQAQVLTRAFARTVLGGVKRKPGDAPVMFFGTREIAWVRPTDLTPWGDGFAQQLHVKGAKARGFTPSVEQVSGCRACSRGHPAAGPLLPRRPLAPAVVDTHACSWQPHGGSRGG